MTESTDTAPAAEPIRVLSTGLSAGELAAVTAVLEAAVEEELEGLHGEVSTGPDAWERSQRVLRTPLQPGPGAWRGFSA